MENNSNQEYLQELKRLNETLTQQNEFLMDQNEYLLKRHEELVQQIKAARRDKIINFIMTGAAILIAVTSIFVSSIR